MYKRYLEPDNPSPLTKYMAKVLKKMCSFVTDVINQDLRNEKLKKKFLQRIKKENKNSTSVILRRETVSSNNDTELIQSAQGTHGDTEMIDGAQGTQLQYRRII